MELDLTKLATLKKVIAEELAVDPCEVTMRASFRRDLGADSLEVLAMVVALEDEFGVTIPDDEALQLLTVQNVADRIAREIAA